VDACLIRLYPDRRQLKFPAGRQPSRIVENCAPKSAAGDGHCPTGEEVKEVFEDGSAQELAAAKAGMDPKTARKYLEDGRLPSETRLDQTRRTRADPFAGVWEELRHQVITNPGLEARTLFEALQRKYPGQRTDGQARTLQRRLKQWRATEGPQQGVFFAQRHVPGRLGQSDFTQMAELGWG
jgi:hypothetical protein